MLKYDKETSFGNQANLLSNTSYQPDQDYVSVQAGKGYDKSKQLALASKVKKKRRDKSAHAKSEYNPTNLNLSMAFPNEMGV